MRTSLTGTRDREFIRFIGTGPSPAYAMLQYFAHRGNDGKTPHAYLVMVPAGQHDVSTFDRDETTIRYEGARAVQALNEANRTGWERTR